MATLAVLALRSKLQKDGIGMDQKLKINKDIKELIIPPRTYERTIGNTMFEVVSSFSGKGDEDIVSKMKRLALSEREENA